MSSAKLIFHAAILAVACAMAGCQNAGNPNQPHGSYAAARRMETGSNIPRPTDADNVSSTVDPSAFDRIGASQAASTARMGSAGGAGR